MTGHKGKARRRPSDRIRKPIAPRASRQARGPGVWERAGRLGLVDLAAIVAAVAMLVTTLVLPPRSTPEPLPLQFRVDRVSLSDLPVVISGVRSCGCWTGPRYQAIKKFKFDIENRGSGSLAIGGGETSSIRLLVAYPRGFEPKVSIPDEESIEGKYVSVASPPDATVWHASSDRDARGSRIVNGNDLFALPDGFEVWAIPAVPNYTVEQIDEKHMSFPTVVDQDELLPGERFSDTRLGHGAWVFYLPMQPKFVDEHLRSPLGLDAQTGKPLQLKPHITRKNTAKYFAVLGIGAFTHHRGVPRFEGFAPTPPDSGLEAPEDM
ncbi:hypothetical protein [Actinokineospora sp. HUAS TT18]|uniref:hypothetical protein n=1 Tax=Actinokineospora sp. HUAS TT18 TaxID=3447451 RepID=UPI003F5254A4